MLTPTPSSVPYGYSIWAGGARVGEVCLEMGWSADEVLSGSFEIGGVPWVVVVYCWLMVLEVLVAVG